ncbi:hypothetical protein [Blastococcus deserti]|uniref:Uncharacterized protein n=1 Tax=Blastococcus deserti TaxID=2259033 RepID=A0ABW4XGP4_9ACTN
MTDRIRRAAVLTVVTLTTCACGAARPAPDAGGPTEDLFPLPSVPADPGPTFEVRPPPPPVSWADGGRRLAVTTWGSSSCPTGPGDVEVVGAREVRVEITFLFPGRDPCTADVAPRTTAVDLPEGVTADQPLTVVLDHDGEEERVELPPADG